MRVDYKKKTEIKEITTQVKVFIAFDGTEFENRDECEKYETEQRNLLRQDIEKCHEADGYPGFDETTMVRRTSIAGSDPKTWKR